MRRSERLKTLKRKLSKLEKKEITLRAERMSEDGKINIEACGELNLTLTNIYLTKKKIEFSMRGESYLGSKLNSISPPN